MGAFVFEAKGLSAGEAQLALSCLQALPTAPGKAAGVTLAEVCQRRGLFDVAAVLERWINS
jgi:hypothetical protein